MTANAEHHHVSSIRLNKLNRKEISMTCTQNCRVGVRSLGNDLVSGKKVTRSNISQRYTIRFEILLMFIVYIQTSRVIIETMSEIRKQNISHREPVMEPGAEYQLSGALHHKSR